MIVALRELYVKEDELNANMLDNFEMCMHLRHEADYGLLYSSESAKTAITYAEAFLKNTLNLL